jgi:hypothetical protein
MSVTSMPHSLPFLSGEVLEKATRVLTDEEKALPDKDFVGKNGQTRSECNSVFLFVRAH